MLGKQGIRLLHIAVIFYVANLYSLCQLGAGTLFAAPVVLLLGIGYYIFLQFVPSYANQKLRSRRLRICGNGCELLILFSASTLLTTVYTAVGLYGMLAERSLPGQIFSEVFVRKPGFWLIHILLAVLVEAIVFWNGMLRVYATSVQLGMRWRVLGILCGWIPLVHLVVLGLIIRTVAAEVQFENEKLLLNEARAGERICSTKYPILLVHGVFFRDSRYLNYWGRIPGELEKNGAEIYYGNHQSAAAVEDSAQEILDRILQIREETGCEKVNIIAHSKGGLDCRYAIDRLGAGEYVASLTTVNSPHRGCEFADYLLTKIPKAQQDAVASTYNATLSRLGDTTPDFMAAVTDLTASVCEERNVLLAEREDESGSPGVFCQSIGSKLNVAGNGRFPLNLSCRLVTLFDGANDGLVGEDSFRWGERFQFLTVLGKRGISHGDIVDLNRENIPEFDVREFFVQLVGDLKRRGL